MNKEGLKYNTERDKLIISEYGRNIQIMIQHLLEIEDREKRTEAAHFIVSVMAQMNPQVKESNDYIHKLWDHLYIISDYKLDVDSPYDPPQQGVIVNKPEHVGYQKRDIKQGHYGSYIKEFLNKIKEIEEKSENGKPYICFFVNGQPIKLKGVNIHEHNPETGHYVTEELMRKDFELMKQNNIKIGRAHV